MFDEYFEWKDEVEIINNIYIKQFIFETIIPEILKSIREEYWSFDDWCWCCSTTILGKEIRQKAKELYWIDL